MVHVDKEGPLPDYDDTKDKLDPEVMETLRMILFVLKQRGASGVSHGMMKRISKQEFLTKDSDMLHRICENAIYFHFIGIVIFKR